VPILLPANLTSVNSNGPSRFCGEWTRWRRSSRLFPNRTFFDWVAPARCLGCRGPASIRGGCGKVAHLHRGFAWRQVICLLIWGERNSLPFAHTPAIPERPRRYRRLAKNTRKPGPPIFDCGIFRWCSAHLPDPAAGFLRAWPSRVRMRTGAVWFTGHEGNEWITRYVDPVRKPSLRRLPTVIFCGIASIPPAVAPLAVIKTFLPPAFEWKGPAKLPYRAIIFAALYPIRSMRFTPTFFDQSS